MNNYEYEKKYGIKWYAEMKEKQLGTRKNNEGPQPRKKMSKLK